MLFKKNHIEIKDQRVDRILKENNLNNCEIFYSPILVWFSYSIWGIVCAFFFITNFISNYWYFVLFYFIIGYFIQSYLNNSFAITQNELVIVNPNFPLVKIEKIEFLSIERIIINQKNIYFLYFSLFSFSGNFIEIYTKNQKCKTYYCVGIGITEDYDENSNQKSLDNFVTSLRLKDIETEMLI